MNTEREAGRAVSSILSDLADAGIELDPAAEAELGDWLRAGARKAIRTGRENDYPRSVRTLQHRLAAVMQDLQRTSPHRTDLSARMGPEELLAGLRALCPIWPFC